MVDCVAIATGASSVNPVLEEAGALGIRAAVVYASGFSEEGTVNGKELERACRNICEKWGITLCGPNCMGMINNVELVSGYGSLPVFPNEPVDRGLGVVAQSGYINSYFMRTYPALVAYAASIGNSCTCSLEDFLLYYAENPHVSCIAAYMEGIKHAEKLEAALRLAAIKHKPVVVLKSGRSEQGAKAAASHTGNLAGNFAAFESMFRRFGVILVDSLEEFSVTAKMFAMLHGRMPNGCGIAAVNFSGGENTLCADFAERYGLNMPNLCDETIRKIQKLIPPYSTASNPLDPTTTMFTQEDKVLQLFRALADDPAVDILMIGDDVSEQSEPKDITCANVFSMLATDPAFPPAFLIPSFEKPRNKELKAKFERSGVVVLSTGELGYVELKNLYRFLQYNPAEHTLQLSLPTANRSGAQRLTLSETASKDWLRKINLPFPKEKKVATLAEVAKAAKTLSFPIAVKIDSPDISHKTEAGGVILNVCDLQQAQEAFQIVMDSCRSYRPQAELQGVLMQEMAPTGVDMILGATNDPQLGLMLMVGVGGVYTELFRDVAMCPCPVSAAEARSMLENLKGFKLLTGYRGSEPADIDILCRLMERLSRYLQEHRDEVAEMDLNPVTVYPKGKGVLVLDALVILYQNQENRHAAE